MANRIIGDEVLIQVSDNDDHFRAISKAKLQELADRKVGLGFDNFEAYVQRAVDLMKVSRPFAVTCSSQVDYEIVPSEEESWDDLREALSGD